VGVRLRKDAKRIELRAIGSPEEGTHFRMTRLTEVAGFTDPRWVLARGRDVRVKAMASPTADSREAFRQIEPRSGAPGGLD
jgi:hypothetical protein